MRRGPNKRFQPTPVLARLTWSRVLTRLKRNTLGRTGGRGALERALAVEVVSVEEGLVYLQITCSNGRTAATVLLYHNLQAIADLADTFRGFPKHLMDRREITLGGTRCQSSQGISLRLGHANHAYLEVQAKSAGLYGGLEIAEFAATVEAAAVDLFVSALDAMPMSVGARAVLSLST
jgi:hypothetical protein